MLSLILVSAVGIIDRQALPAVRVTQLSLV